MVFYGAWQPIGVPTAEAPTYDDWCMETSRIIPRAEPDDWPLEYAGRGYALNPPGFAHAPGGPLSYISTSGYQAWANYNPSFRTTGCNHPTYPGLMALVPGDGFSDNYPYAYTDSWPPDVLGWTVRMPDGRISPDFLDYNLCEDYYGNYDVYDEWYYAGGESDFYEWQGTQYIPCPQFKCWVRHDYVDRSVPMTVALGYVSDASLHWTDVGWSYWNYVDTDYITPSHADVAFTHLLKTYTNPIGGWDPPNHFYDENDVFPVAKHVNNCGPYSDFQSIVVRIEEMGGATHSYQGFAEHKGYGAEWNDFRWIYAVDRSGPGAASPLDFSRVGTGTKAMLFDSPGGT